MNCRILGIAESRNVVFVDAFFELQTGREIYKASSDKKLHVSMWCRDFGRGFDATYQVCKRCIP